MSPASDREPPPTGPVGRAPDGERLLPRLPHAPDEGRSGRPEGPSGRPLKRGGPHPMLVVGTALGVVLVAGAITLAIALGWGDAQEPAPSAPVAGAPSSRGPVETPPGAPALPADCAGLYTHDWTPDMAGNVLNPEWAVESAAERPASLDREIAAAAQEHAVLTCSWANPRGGSGMGITTKVGYADDVVQEAVLGRMAELGYGCWEELDGTRCVAETGETTETGRGDSHFFRDGVWFATYWIALGPDGYTHDMVAAVFDR